jgi:hypothetical protein
LSALFESAIINLEHIEVLAQCGEHMYGLYPLLPPQNEFYDEWRQHFVLKVWNVAKQIFLQDSSAKMRHTLSKILLPVCFGADGVNPLVLISEFGFSLPAAFHVAKGILRK